MSFCTCAVIAAAVTVPAAPDSFDGSPCGDSCAATMVVSGVTLVVPVAALAVML